MHDCVMWLNSSVSGIANFLCEHHDLFLLHPDAPLFLWRNSVCNLHITKMQWFFFQMHWQDWNKLSWVVADANDVQWRAICEKDTTTTTGSNATHNTPRQQIAGQVSIKQQHLPSAASVCMPTCKIKNFQLFVFLWFAVTFPFISQAFKRKRLREKPILSLKKVIIFLFRLPCAPWGDGIAKRKIWHDSSCHQSSWSSNSDAQSSCASFGLTQSKLVFKVSGGLMLL